jgi:CheY-like chemotaxis protein
MAPQVLERALEPFYTTKELGKGTGLGLAMAYSTVKAHQGQLELESEPGRGTRVRLCFPASAARAADLDRGGAQPPEGWRRILNILLVDDDELIQSSIPPSLEGQGHQVTTAWSGEEAIAAIEGGLQPDLVLLDLGMPGLGGAATLGRLRELRPRVPVILATGLSDREALALAEAHPRVSLLPKPFTLEDLLRQLVVLSTEAAGPFR